MLGNVVDLVKIPPKSMMLLMGLGQLLRIPAKRRLGHLQVPLQHLHFSAQLCEKSDELRNRLRKKPTQQKTKRVRTNMRSLKGVEILRLPSHLLV